MQNYRYPTPEYMRRGNAVSCPPDDTPNMVLAMAYVPWQEWNSLYDLDKALHCGTIFDKLNKPFHGMGGCS